MLCSELPESPNNSAGASSFRIDRLDLTTRRQTGPADDFWAPRIGTSPESGRALLHR